VSSQAKHYHGKHIPKVLNPLQDPGTLLFIEGGRKLAVIPFFRALTALSDCPRYIPGLSVIQKKLAVGASRIVRESRTDYLMSKDGLSVTYGRTVRPLEGQKLVYV
jgi:hypothetical protein